MIESGFTRRASRRAIRWAGAAAVLALTSASRAPAQTAAAPPPNIVLIITDDMGWADLGSYGAVDVRTPNLDRLASEGIRLTDFYANGVLCSPTRAGLISGRYQQRYGVEAALGSAGTPGADEGLAARGHSLPELLRRSGYTTGLIGKWPLGYLPEMSPAAHGFDHFFGMKSGYHDYYTHKGRDGKPDLWEDGRLVDVPGYTTDLITERAVRFIERSAGRPFFVDVAYNAPHWPYQVPDRPSVSFDNARHLMPGDSMVSTRADYVAMVERVDRGVGELLRTLERTGLARNTIVIFTNDNGGEWLANGGPLFHRKWTVWEGGIRVPTIVRWPGRIPAGRVSGQVGITMDLTASILAVAGATVPAAARLEGMNLFPILEGRASDVERTLFWRTSVGGQRQKAVRHGDWKLVVDGTHYLMFDLATDQGERHDLAGRRPEVARTLRGLLADWERDIDAEAKARAEARAR
jgi:arylsulfatase A-like enzyme